VPGLGEDLVLVPGTRSDSRDEQLPDTRAPQGAHGVDPAVPQVEVADHPHRAGVGRPHRERGPLGALDGAHVGPEDLPQAPVPAFPDEVEVRVTEGGPEPVGILVAVGGPVLVLGLEPVGGAPLAGLGQLGLEQAGRVGPLHHHGVPVRGHHPHGRGARAPGSHHAVVEPEQLVGIAEVALHQTVHRAIGGHRTTSQPLRGRWEPSCTARLFTGLTPSCRATRKTASRASSACPVWPPTQQLRS